MAAGYASGCSGTSSRWRLPGWARADLAGVGKTRVCGTLHKDSPVPSIRANPLVQRTGQSRTGVRDEEKRGEVGKRVAQLERSIVFLRKQHMETLQQLHSETDQLKRENRELSFRMLMCCCGHTNFSSNGSKTGHQPPSSAEANTPTNELHVLFLQEEAEQLRQALAKEKQRNEQMLHLLQNQLQDPTTIRRSSGERMAGKGPYHQECEAAIKLLQKEKEQKAHELTQIRADLRDILFSHKWTPEAYLRARAYVSHPSSRGEHTQRRGRAFQRVQDNVHLPALKPYLLGGAAERQHRRQAVQKKTSSMRLPALHPPD